ncbi:MAG: hypothetical protein V2J13_11205, partial [Cycloclasticus sp.]|nr:hypothetical protein [Cycloclasticus sp.]
IGDDLKTYQVTADVDSDASGEATIPINTPLQSSPADNAGIYADSQFRCALADDDIDAMVSTELHYGLTLQLLEVLY